MQEKEIKIFIVDDYLLIREGIKFVINNLPNAKMVGESTTITNIAAEIGDLNPDLLILELNLCDRPISRFMEEIKSVSPKTKVLIVSDCYCELPVITSIRAGISGFVNKNVSEIELIAAIDAISQGTDYFTPAITQLLANGYLSGKASGINFSERELEILRYICKGRSNEQLAEILFISEKTVATHRKNIMKKACVKKTSDLIIWALENKIVQN